MILYKNPDIEITTVASGFARWRFHTVPPFLNDVYSYNSIINDVAVPAAWIIGTLEEQE